MSIFLYNVLQKNKIAKLWRMTKQMIVCPLELHFCDSRKWMSGLCFLNTSIIIYRLFVIYS